MNHALHVLKLSSSLDFLAPVYNLPCVTPQLLSSDCCHPALWVCSCPRNVASTLRSSSCSKSTVDNSAAGLSHNSDGELTVWSSVHGNPSGELGRTHDPRSGSRSTCTTPGLRRWKAHRRMDRKGVGRGGLLWDEHWQRKTSRCSDGDGVDGCMETPN